MIMLEKEQVMMLHSMLLKRFGGSDGVRDHGLLESALRTPFQTFEGEELYPTLKKKAASLCYGLVNNHCFVDGNKRVGVLAMMTFLDMNERPVECTDVEMIQLGLGIADGTIKQADIYLWIVKHTEE